MESIGSKGRNPAGERRAVHISSAKDICAAPYVTVAGGVNIDIGGQPRAKLVAADSNPGTVGISFGGVGRNIAHNLALLEVDVRLVTAFGDDENARRVAADCAASGIDVSAALTVPGGRTGTYLFINDAEGDLALAVSDMEIYDHLTPEVLDRRRELLSGSRAVVADANLPAESIRWLAENCAAPLFADPVSTAKAGKLKPVLGKLHTLKPNRLEAELLSGVSIRGEDDLHRCADALLETGLEQVFISLGADGVFAADRREQVHLPVFPAELKNATGCGDASMAAIVWAFLRGAGLTDAAKAALAAGAIAMEGSGTINPALSPVTLAERAGLML